MWTDEKAIAMALLQLLQRDNPATRMFAKQLTDTLHYDVSLEDMHAAVKWMDTHLTEEEYASRFDAIEAQMASQLGHLHKELHAMMKKVEAHDKSLNILFSDRI